MELLLTILMGIALSISGFMMGNMPIQKTKKILYWSSGIIATTTTTIVSIVSKEWIYISINMALFILAYIIRRIIEKFTDKTPDSYRSYW